MEFVFGLVRRLLGPAPFLELLTQTGTFAGAISGIRLASAKRFDWFGAYVIGFVTAVGGGTLRDTMLLKQPCWLESPSYLVTTFVALVAVALFGRRFISEQITWYVFDTISISVFMVLGIEKTIVFYAAKAQAAGLAFAATDCWWQAVVMGVLTAAFGGVLRDICINEVPLIFRKELYALACAAGGVIYFGLVALGVDVRVAGVTCIAAIFVIRALAIKYHLGVPVLTGRRAKMLHHHHNRAAARRPGAVERAGESRKENT